MTKDLTTIDGALKKIDISSLIKYTNLINKIGSLSKMQTPDYMRDFICAIDDVNIMLTSAIKLDLDAKAALDCAESIAYLDRAGDYLKGKEIKDSAESRKKYINIDTDVVKAKEIKAKTEALVVFLKNKLQIFRYSHDDVKKIGYGDQKLTNFEGY